MERGVNQEWIPWRYVARIDQASVLSIDDRPPFDSDPQEVPGRIRRELATARAGLIDVQLRPAPYIEGEINVAAALIRVTNAQSDHSVSECRRGSEFHVTVAGSDGPSGHCA